MTYICLGSGEEHEGKPWITLTMDRWDDIKGPATFSSYLEYRKCIDRIPRSHFHLIQNKEDFDYIAPCVNTTPPKQDFVFLTETEINQLSQEEYRNYKLNYEENCFLNETKAKIHEESLLEDARSRYLEEYENSENESLEEDDY
jgi:hypothetical protein